MENNILNEVKKIINMIGNQQKNKKNKKNNINNYFLVDNSVLCNPLKISESNLKFIDDCYPLTSKGIYSNNINDRLDEIKLIQLKFGGKNIRNIIYEGNYNFKTLNNALIDLLKYGIIPINNKGLYHFDIKDDNILFDGKHAKLIDWGLSAFIKNRDIIPDIIKRRPLQYNLPFSVILLSDRFNKKIINYLIPYNRENIYNFIKNYYNYYYKEYSKNLGYAFNSNKSSKLTKENIDTLAINYCFNIVDKFTNKDTGIFYVEIYFKEVFLKNVDKYGFIISYLFFFKSNYLNNFYDKNKGTIYKNKLQNIFNKYCFSDKYATTEIPERELINDLLNLVG